jgi:hypothetical protein
MHTQAERISSSCLIDLKTDAEQLTELVSLNLHWLSLELY